jgi:DNA-binding IclR family transcriptional regulator
MALLELIGVEPQSLASLAGHINVSRSTALRLAQSLERAGVVRKRGDGRYVLGRAVLTLAAQALASYEIRDVARPYLYRLNQMCGHTIHLASLVDGEAIYIDKYEASTSIRMYSQVGKQVPLQTSAVGKVILAYQQEPRLSDLIARINFRRFTSETITNEFALRKELEITRERGYGVDRGEFEEGIVCVAAPIRMADSSVSAGVSITVPKMLVTLDELALLLPDLIDTADAVSKANGWTGETRQRTTAPSMPAEART